MNDETKQLIRQLSIKLLDDENGISHDSYNLLVDLMNEAKNCYDITYLVVATNDRFYLKDEDVQTLLNN